MRELLENCLDGLSQLNGTDFNHTINELKEKLELKGELDLTANWEDKVAIIWQVDDVRDHAERNDFRVPTVDAAREILAEMDRRHDANNGISWDTIEWHLQDRGYAK